MTAFDLLMLHNRPSVRTGLSRLDKLIRHGKGFPPGDCITITGEGGSGKSTLIRAMIIQAILP